MEFVWLLISLVILYFGAEWLVGGASSLAARLRISPLIIGLTIVSMGTSAPELVVSIKAAMAGQSALSIGNVLGSNLFNTALILGVSALIIPLTVKRQLLKVDVPVMVGATLLFLIMFLDGKLSFTESIILVGLFISYMAYLLIVSLKNKDTNENNDIIIRIYKHWAIDVSLIGVGLVGLIYGSDLLVDNAIVIAKNLGMSEAMIGLTIVAAGTSIPELATSIVAALKRQTDIAIGNVVGSNTFNLLLILGTAGAIHPIQTPDINITDSLFLLGTGLLLWLFMKTSTKLGRFQGLIFLLAYIGYYVMKIFVK
ncbi:MAG: calcium/sodium antiporter [Proteiniphilum sp.]|nr:calcium/sodium antiporter [Proteiniphilum sp.]